MIPLLLVASLPDLPYRDELIARARSESLAAERGWQALGHYRSGPFRTLSEVDSTEFFLAPEGQHDPEAELVATLTALFQPADREDHPACAFPARRAYLMERLAIDATRIPSPPCPKLDEWLTNLKVRSATLIFAGPFLGNPASMFGHTFLRLNQGPGGDLTSYTVNFAALPTTEFGPAYAVMGLIGGFRGMFWTVPYYLKVREYNDFESRDIWEYDLNLSDAELRRLLLHLHELGRAFFWYFYLDENCSYQLLAALEAANPERFHFMDAFPAWAIPVDTLRAALAVPGLVTTSRHRPSQRALALAHRERLTSDEGQLAKALSESPARLGEVAALTSEIQVRVLDAAYELFRYRTKLQPADNDKELEQELLIRRGRILVKSEPIEVPPPTAPEVAHATSAFAVAGGVEESGAFISLTLRPVLHDLLDDQRGYVENSQIEILTIEARVRMAAALPELEALDLLRITSIAPVDAWSVKPSWRLQTGISRIHELGCEGSACMYYLGSGSAGLATQLGPVSGYLLADLEIGLGPPFPDVGRIGLGGSAGLIFQLGPRWRLLGEGRLLYPLLGVPLPNPVPGTDDGPNFRLFAGSTVRLSSAFELRAMGQLGRGYHEASLGLWTFF